MTVLKVFTGGQWVDVGQGPKGDSAYPNYSMLANRPSAASVPDKTLYWASDDNGGTLYQRQSPGGVPTWVKMLSAGDASGSSLAYQELAATWASGNFAAANAAVDIPGLSIAVVSGIRPFRVELQAGVQHVVGGAATGTFVTVTLRVQQSIDAGTTWTIAGTSSITDAPTTGSARFQSHSISTTLIVPPANATAYMFKATAEVTVAGSAINVWGRNNSVTTALEAANR